MRKPCGIAGGICKRRWTEIWPLIEDLQRAAEYYRRGALGPVGDDGYAQIKRGFHAGFACACIVVETLNQQEANPIRKKILDELRPLDNVKEENQWWKRRDARAVFGLGRHSDAAAALKASPKRPEILALADDRAAVRERRPKLRHKCAAREPRSRALDPTKRCCPGATQAADLSPTGKARLSALRRRDLGRRFII